MGTEEIILQEILAECSDNYKIARENNRQDYSTISSTDAIKAMKLACKLTSQMAANNVTMYNHNEDCHHMDQDGNYPEYYIVDKDSILNLINRIK